MDRLDDYEDEMGRLSAEQIEAILEARETGDPAADRAAALIGELRETLATRPGPDVTARHLAAIAAANRPTEVGRLGAYRRRWETMRRGTRRKVASLGLAAALVMGAGIAAAVTLPDEANDRARQVVPEDAGPPENLPSSSDHGTTVSETAKDPQVIGCEKGRAVSDVATAKATEHRQDPGARPDCPTTGGAPAGIPAGPPAEIPAGPPDEVPAVIPGDAGGSGGGGSDQGSGSGSGGPGGGSGGGGSNQGSGGGSGGPGGGSGGGGSNQGSGGGGSPETLPTP